MLSIDIYTLGVFTESPVVKSLERNVVYIPIITLSHATHMNLNKVRINYGSLHSEWMSAAP